MATQATSFHRTFTALAAAALLAPCAALGASRAGSKTARPKAKLSAEEAAELKASLVVHSDGGVVKLREDISVPKGKSISGSVVALGGDVDVEGGVQGDVVVLGGSARVAGSVDGAVVVIGKRAVLGPEASIRGALVTVATQVQRDPSSTVKGPTVTLHGLKLLAPLLSLATLFAFILFWLRMAVMLAWLLLAALAGLLLAGPLQRAASTLSRRPAASALLGIAYWPAVALAAAALVVSILGLPLTPLLALATAFACAGGYLTAGQWLGGALLSAAPGRWSPWLPCFLGVGLLQALYAVPVAGPAANFAALVAGLGALLLSLSGPQEEPV